MVYSGDQVERIQLSESTAWSGAPATSDVSPTALQFLPRVRELLLAGRYAEAQQLAGEHLLGRPTSFGTNLPLPELQIEFTAEGETTDCTRSLNFNLALVRTEFRRNGTTVTREVFASHTDDLIVVRLQSSTPGALIQGLLQRWRGPCRDLDRRTHADPPGSCLRGGAQQRPARDRFRRTRPSRLGRRQHPRGRRPPAG
jgi:Glycosyl hydrolase family 65, N-terminal domain